MSIRVAVTSIIVFINLLIIITAVTLGSMYVSSNIKAAQEADMSVVAEMANLLISNEIDILHLRASVVAKDLAMADASVWDRMLSEVSSIYPEFIGVAVFDTKVGRILASGDKPAPIDALESTHIAGALRGERKLNRTYFYNTDLPWEPGRTDSIPGSSPDDVVFYVAVPFPTSSEMLLALTIPGMFFHELLINFEIWDTGHVFMIDTEGTMVSNPRRHWVFQRTNIPEMAIVDSEFTALAETASLMASGEDGIGYYTVNKIPRVCAYKRVTGSEDGWSLGTVAPLPESPFRNINRGLVATGAIGLLLGIIAAWFGSTFIKRPFDKVETLMAEAERNSKYKSQFLANMSHEMRTPLTAVLGLTELTLRTVHLDNETHSNLIKVYRSGETLLGLINDILDISKIEADKLTLNPVEYDLPSMLNDTITQSILYVGEKPVELILDLDENLPRRLFGDELRVKQILNNLLSNAFKFTAEGSVTLKVGFEKDSDAIWLTAQVTDTGCGIKPEHFEKLFTLYAHMERANKVQDSSRRIEGTGLGLSISKKIAEMMQGSITVESEYGKGSVFTVRLRQDSVDEDIIGIGLVESLKKFHYSIDKFLKADSSRINLSYARVLVVDDNSANLDVAKGLMSLYGMKIDCVTGGQQAIDAMKDDKVKYNAIFMDHMMPEIDGIEATRLIREIDSDYARNIPIIALTANAVVGNEEMFLSKGFQAFIAKPIDLSRLDFVLRQWVRDKDAEELLPNKYMQTEDRLDTTKDVFSKNIPGVDIGRCISHFVTEEVLIAVLRSFADNTKPLLEAIKDVTPDNLPQYAIIVHGIKGSCRGIYAQDVGDSAEALEMAAKASDIDFVIANNQCFIEKAKTLISDIEEALGEKKKQLPQQDKIEKSLLNRFITACDSLDIDEMDATMLEIEKFNYTSDAGLSHWLREKLDQGKYKDIKVKLLEEINE